MYIYMCVCACVRARARLHDIYIERERERERGGETEQNIAQFSPVAAYHYVIKISRIALKSMIFLAMSYFYTLPHKGTFKKKLNMKHVFWFSLLSSAESFIVRRVERHIIRNEHMSSCKVTVIIVRFTLKLNFHNRFLTVSRNHFQKIRPFGAELFHADG